MDPSRGERHREAGPKRWEVPLFSRICADGLPRPSSAFPVPENTRSLRPEVSRRRAVSRSPWADRADVIAGGGWNAGNRSRGVTSWSNGSGVAPSSQLAPAGAPQYSAPEQFLTEHGDERSDLYALGSRVVPQAGDRRPWPYGRRHATEPGDLNVRTGQEGERAEALRCREAGPPPAPGADRLREAAAPRTREVPFGEPKGTSRVIEISFRAFSRRCSTAWRRHCTAPASVNSGVWPKDTAPACRGGTHRRRVPCTSC